jgi:hypothetical protein
VAVRDGVGVGDRVGTGVGLGDRVDGSRCDDGERDGRGGPDRRDERDGDGGFDAAELARDSDEMSRRRGAASPAAAGSCCRRDSSEIAAGTVAGLK